MQQQPPPSSLGPGKPATPEISNQPGKPGRPWIWLLLIVTVGFGAYYFWARSRSDQRAKGTVNPNMQPARAGGRTRGGGIPPVVAVKAYVAADVATAQATATQLENARLSYQAQLAGDYFELHGIDGDVDLFQRTVNSYKDYLDLARTRFNAGVASDADVAQAETQLDTTQAQLIDLEVARTQSPF
jgi:outer membrane protein TolC